MKTGFINDFYNVSKDKFINKSIYDMINNAKNGKISKDSVPKTYYFLWDDDKIVGLFKIKHYLTDDMKKNYKGHIAYGILKEYRGRGYASRGLKLIIEEAKKIVDDDRICFHCRLNNKASLKVQQKNGAIIKHKDVNGYFTVINIERKNNG